MDEVRGLVAQALDEVRQLAFDLRPTVLEDVGLEAALRRLASEITDRFGLSVRFHLMGIDQSFGAFGEAGAGPLAGEHFSRLEPDWDS